MNDEEEKIIVIGADHINTLSVIRCLGRKKLKFTILIHNDNKTKNELMTVHSKFSKNLVLLKNREDDIVKWLLDNKNKNYKKLIIPCSDLAEYTIDNHFSILCKYYFIQGFKNKNGQVCKLMDKYEQKKWADNHNILMARTWKINREYTEKEINEITIPCIAKPCVSAFGKKSDIRVCNSKSELNKTIKYYFDSGYDKILFQEFLDKEYELCCLGCILDNQKKYGKIIKKIREYPKSGGSASFAQFIDDPAINEKIDIIVNSLVSEGYNGLYDMDIIKSHGKYYLNEINFRNSGNNYALMKAGIETPYILYLEKYDKELLSRLNIRTKNIYLMEDISNLNSLIKKEITVFTFIKDFIRARAHSIYSIKDLNIILYYIKKKGKHNERSNRKT